ncbi:cytochrome c biogenesis factor [Anaerolinea thermolimosa]|uniref:tetratricopeptide repeat protein n=1 Tax=Anaerolinea thermolimosa TaxID=229919 RepID=UPI000781A23E|nr:tetratricopeptide repeat protein [Anaerolinea thermolimosa]GAP07780.1 cytochrome c biogenesis factor [Anaerolinea thermolimosa]
MKWICGFLRWWWAPALLVVGLWAVFTGGLQANRQALGALWRLAGGRAASLEGPYWQALEAIGSGGCPSPAGLSAEEKVNAAYIAFLRGNEMRKAKQSDKAIGAFRCATMLDGLKGEYYRGLAAAFAEADMPEDALINYQLAAQIDPLGSTAALARFLWYPLRDYARMEQVLARALEAYPQAPARAEWWMLLGNALRAQKKYDGALEAYHRSLALNPDRPESYAELAQCYREMGRPAEALEMINQALEKAGKPTPAWVLRRAAQVYEWAGQAEAALNFARQVLAQAPEDASMLQLVERLTKP